MYRSWYFKYERQYIIVALIPQKQSFCGESNSFRKKVGLGTIIIGVGIIMFSALSVVTLYTDNEVFTLIGTGILIAGIIVGLVISFKAMIKYNKGIF